MKFDPPLQRAQLLRRYKRFLTDVETPEGAALTLHCPNTGSMLNCGEPGCRIWYWDSQSSTRKYPCTWELVEVQEQYLACINTARANHLVHEAIESGVITELQGYSEIRKEVRLAEGRSRIDLMLSHEEARCYVEVKSVTLLQEDGLGTFPDAVSQRASKHLQELVDLKRAGHRAVLLFCVVHTGIQRVAPADSIDPAYGIALREAQAAGVELLAYGAHIDTASIYLERSLPVLLP